jgi:hypothetical protein
MPSLRNSSLAIRSSPQVGLLGAISRISSREFGGSSGRPRLRDFHCHKTREAFTMPFDEHGRLDECVAPIEKPRAHDHGESPFQRGSFRLDLALPKHGELFAKEEILGDERCAGRKEETGARRATWHSTSVRYAVKNLDVGDFEDARASEFNQNPRASRGAPDLLEP